MHSITELHIKIHQIFNIVFPIEQEEFIKACAIGLKKFHGDGLEEGQADRQKFMEALSVFKEAKSRFDELNGHNRSSGIDENKTRNGDLLSELGKGLGPTINGRRCGDCGGKGWKSTEIIDWTDEQCPRCGGEGFLYQDKCNKCNNGKFTTRKGFIVNCRACGGTGIHKYKNPRRCPECSGLGMSFGFDSFWNQFFGFGIGQKRSRRVLRVVKDTCSTCKGTGEIKLHNPVFQKGSMNINNLKDKFNYKSEAISIKDRRYRQVLRKSKQS